MTASSGLLDPIFGSALVAACFCDRALVQRMLDFEAALAAAEADVGVIPADSAVAIAEACDAKRYDIGAMGQAAALAGNPALPLVRALTQKVEGAARGHVHWGATSQDAIDTALMLAAREALPLICAELDAASAALISLADAHRTTLMAGRTFMQQALPISFGYKCAAWLTGLTEARRAIRRAESEALALQFGGAAGTLAALGDKGLAVRAALAKKLGLREAPVTWHATRGRIATLAFALAGVSGAAAKIAGDVLLLMQSEVGEAFEPAAPGKGGSSTMPHKRNPVGAAAIRANHRRVAGLVATIVAGMEQEHERAPGGWAAEWQTLRDLFSLAGGSAERLRTMLEGLEVDPARMRQNLDATLGLPMAESLAMTLAEAIGRDKAHAAIAAASGRAVTAGRPLAEIAAADDAIAAALSPEAIERALDPARYLGAAAAMIDAAIAEAGAENPGKET